MTAAQYNVSMTVEITSQSKLLRCRRCDAPLAKMRPDGTIAILKYHKGETVEVDIKVQHARGGVVSIGCDDCKGLVTPHYFITLVADQAVSR
jgi:hypothetical protein